MNPEVMRTTYPDEQLSEAEWMKEFKVSTRVTKHWEGSIQAQDMMRQWQESKYTFIFQHIADKLSTK